MVQLKQSDRTRGRGREPEQSIPPPRYGSQHRTASQRSSAELGGLRAVVVGMLREMEQYAGRQEIDVKSLPGRREKPWR